jgi:RHS repeat-associated protein
VNKIEMITTADDQILYQYNEKDEVVEIANRSAVVRYQRDAKQRIINENVSSDVLNYPSHNISYSYNKLDQRMLLESNFQNISYSYTNSDQLESLISSATGNYGFNYDEANRLVQISRPGSTSQFSYDLGSSLSKISHKNQGATEISFHEYTYDLRNYITQKRSLGSTQNYNYDLNGQLLSSSKQEDPAQNETFSYDSLGNRLTYNGVASSYDNSGQRIQDDGKYTYVFDLNGNIIYKSNKQNGISYTFEYSALNQVKKAVITSSPLNGEVLKTIFYKYDPLGRRISRHVVENTGQYSSQMRKYYYDGSHIIAELDGSNNLLASYTHSPLAADDILGAKLTSDAVTAGLSSAQGYVYYLKDHLGSVNEVVNANGSIIQKMEYGAFGQLRSVKNSSNEEVSFESAPVRTSFTYTGREFEPELGMYYYRARYYDPSTGRFLQSDPNAGYLTQPITTINKYIYAINNPILFSDPSGRDIWDDIGRGLSIVAAAVVAVYAGAAVSAFLGLSGTLTGALAGAFTGALAGGATAAIGYSLSHSDPQEGFRIGAALGFIAGGLGGYYAENFVNIKSFTGIKSNQVYGFAKDQISSAASGYRGGSDLVNALAQYGNIGSWPIWSNLAGYANAALPYAVAIGEAGAIGYLDQCTGARDCSGLVPKNGSKNWNWSF